MLNHGKKQQQYKRGLHRGHHQKLIRTTLFSALFRQFAILSEIIKLICTHCETGQKSLLPVSKVHTNKLYIFYNVLISSI